MIFFFTIIIDDKIRFFYYRHDSRFKSRTAFVFIILLHEVRITLTALPIIPIKLNSFFYSDSTSLKNKIKVIIGFLTNNLSKSNTEQGACFQSSCLISLLMQTFTTMKQWLWDFDEFGISVI